MPSPERYKQKTLRLHRTSLFFALMIPILIATSALTLRSMDQISYTKHKGDVVVQFQVKRGGEERRGEEGDTTTKHTTNE